MRCDGSRVFPEQVASSHCDSGEFRSTSTSWYMLCVSVESRITLRNRTLSVLSKLHILLFLIPSEEYKSGHSVLYNVMLHDLGQLHPLLHGIEKDAYIGSHNFGVM